MFIFQTEEDEALLAKTIQKSTNEVQVSNEGEDGKPAAYASSQYCWSLAWSPLEGPELHMSTREVGPGSRTTSETFFLHTALIIISQDINADVLCGIQILSVHPGR